MENEQFKIRDERVWGGLFLLGIGIVLFMQQSGFPFPGWLFKWPSILIVTGIFVGLKTRFRGPAWAILLIIGSIFMFDVMSPGFGLRRYTAPIIIITIGLVMIFRPRRNLQDRNLLQGNAFAEQKPLYNTDDADTRLNVKQDFIDSVAIFGGVRKIIVSKNFQGGDVVAMFGGNEIDLSQADIHGQVTLEVTQIFGGTKLIIPSHWNIKPEMVALFSGIEDKRRFAASVPDTNKVLVIKGTSVFGGIEIRNY